MNKLSRFANIILVTAIIFFLLVFIYAFYKSGSGSSGKMYIYYFSSVIGIAIFLIALRLHEDIKVKLALLTLTLGLGVYMCDIFLIYYDYRVGFDQQRPHRARLAKIAMDMGVPFETRTKYQVFEDLRKKGVDAYPHTYTDTFIVTNGLDHKGNKIYPFGAISNKTIITCNETGEFRIFNSDEHGFSNPKGLYNRGRNDIFLIGDSITHGSCVKSGEEISGWLRKMGIKVLNLGAPGSGPLVELGILKEYAEPFSPRIVLWMYFERNDQLNLYREKTSPFLLKYLDKDFSQNLLFKQEKIDEALIALIEEAVYKKNERDIRKRIFYTLTRIVKLSHLRAKIIKLINLIKVPKGRKPTPLFKDILAKAKNRVSGWGGQLFFVYLPAYERYKRTNHTNFYRNEVLLIVKELGIPVIDVHEAFVAHPDPISLFSFRIDLHYNSEGYKVVAQKIQKYLNNELEGASAITK